MKDLEKKKRDSYRGRGRERLESLLNSSKNMERRGETSAPNSPRTKQKKKKNPTTKNPTRTPNPNQKKKNKLHPRIRGFPRGGMMGVGGVRV